MHLPARSPFLFAPLAFALGVACGDGDDASGRAADARSSDAGADEVGPSSDTGATDGGAAEAGMDGGGADAGSAFVPGTPSPEWTEEVRTRMVLGLEDGSCGLYRGPGGEALRTEVRFRPSSSIPVPTESTWTWRIMEGDGAVVREETFAVPAARRIELAGRGSRLGSDRFREDTYGFVRPDRPIVVELDASRRPAAGEWTVTVEGTTSVRTSMGGSGSNLPEEVHRFTWTARDVATPTAIRPGYAVTHAIDDQVLTRYEVVPAFGILAFEHAGLRYALCDFRLCAPEGCAGAATCTALTCP